MDKKSKRCTVCGESKFIESFYKDKYRSDGYSRMCKKCENKKSNKYYHANKKRRKYIKKHSKQYREQQKQWIKENRERYNELQREARHRRKAKESKLVNDFTTNDWRVCQDYFSNKSGQVECCYCGQPAKDIEKEHFIAVNNGGGYTASNILPACKSCNSSKQDKDFFEWYPSQEFYSEERVDKILKYFNFLRE